MLPLLASHIHFTGIIQLLLLPLTDLNRVVAVIGGVLLDRLAATDRLHGDSGLEFGTVSAALANEWEPLFQGRYSASEVKIGPVQKNLQEALQEALQDALQKALQAAVKRLSDAVRMLSGCSRGDSSSQGGSRRS